MPEHPASVNIAITRRIGRIGYARASLRTLLLALCPTLLHRNRQSLPAFGRQASALAFLRLRFRCGTLGPAEALLAAAWHDRSHQRLYGSAEPVFLFRQICQ